jgi:predicted esterase
MKRSPRTIQLQLQLLLLLLLVLSLAAVACSAASPPAHRVHDAPPAQSLELDGARMLVTTTRAARGRKADELPILIVLPWSKSTPAEALAEVGYIDIDVPARIVAIEGFERDGKGFSWWRRTRPAPEDPDRDDELVPLLTDRAARLAALFGIVRRHFRNAAPPVVSGISQGGDLSIALGVLHPTVISAALPIAARFPEPMLPAPAEPGTALPLVDVYQGAADPKAPIAPLQRAIASLRGRGYPIVLHAYDGVVHEVSPAERADIRACAALRLRGSREPCPVSAAP